MANGKCTIGVGGYTTASDGAASTLAGSLYIISSMGPPSLTARGLRQFLKIDTGVRLSLPPSPTARGSFAADTDIEQDNYVSAETSAASV